LAAEIGDPTIMYFEFFEASTFFLFIQTAIWWLFQVPLQKQERCR